MKKSPTRVIQGDPLVLLFSALGLLIGGYTASEAAPPGDTVTKVVIQVSTGDPVAQRVALKDATALTLSAVA